MLKKLTLIAGFLAVAAGTAFAQNAVTLDINRVIEVFSKTAAIKEEVEADAKEAESIQKIKIDEFQRQREKLNAAVAKLNQDRGNPTLTKAAVEKTEKEVEALYKETAAAEQNLRQSQQEMQQLLQQKFAQKTNVVLQDDILPRIKEIAKARGAEIVLNLRAGVIFAEPTADITNELIERLEKDFPAAEEPAAAAN